MIPNIFMLVLSNNLYRTDCLSLFELIKLHIMHHYASRIQWGIAKLFYSINKAVFHVITSHKVICKI